MFINLVDHAGMPADRRIQLVKHVVAGHEGLAGAALLAGAAVVDHGAFGAGLLKIFLDGDGRGKRAHAEQVVAAALAGIFAVRLLLQAVRLLSQAAQGVIFAQDAQHGLSVTETARERRRDPADPLFHFKAFLAKETDQRRGRLPFGKSQFGGLPDRIRRRIQSGRVFIYDLFCCVHGHLPPAGIYWFYCNA